MNLEPSAEIVVMKPDASQDQINHMVSHIRELGMTPQVIIGKFQTVIAALGQERTGLVEELEPGAGVEKVLPIMAPYKRGEGARSGDWRSQDRDYCRPLLGRE